MIALAGRRATLLAFALMLSSCQPTFGGRLHVAATRSEETVQINWDSNLPPGSVIDLEVFQSEAFDEALSHNAADQFPYLIEVNIVVGQTSSSLTESIAGWPAGTGVATMVFAPSPSQPAEVQRILGANGEHLGGPQVTVDSDGKPQLADTARFLIP